MNLFELRSKIKETEQRHRALVGEIKQLADRDHLDVGETERWERQTRAEEASREKLTALREELRTRIAEGVEDGTFMVEGGTFADDSAGPTFLRSREARKLWRDVPWADQSEVRNRAMVVAERGDDFVDRSAADDVLPIADADRERLQDLLRNDRRGDLAEYLVAASSPAYMNAFRMMVGGNGHLLSDEERQAVRAVNRTVIASEGTPTRDEFGTAVQKQFGTEARASLTEAGTSAMTPVMLDPSIILTNTGTVNPFRQVCRVEMIPTNQWKGVTSAGVTAEWSAEANPMADATPTLATATVPVIRADAYVQYSYEFGDDTQFEQQILGLMVDAKNRIEADGYAIGTGSTQPTGIVTALNLVTASRVSSVTTAAYGAIDVFNVAASLPARWQPDAKWVQNYQLEFTVRQFAASNGQWSSTFWADFSESAPPALLGRALYSNSSMTSSILSGSNILIFGNWQQHLVVDRIGLRVLTNPVVVGANGRPTGERGVFAFWRTGSNTLVPDAFRQLRIK